MRLIKPAWYWLKCVLCNGQTSRPPFYQVDVVYWLFIPTAFQSLLQETHFSYYMIFLRLTEAFMSTKVGSRGGNLRKHKMWRFTTRLAHITTLTQRTSQMSCKHKALKSAASRRQFWGSASNTKADSEVKGLQETTICWIDWVTLQLALMLHGYGGLRQPQKDSHVV